MTDVDDFLAHYGVKGMKWGVRKRNTTRTPEEQRARNKKIAVGVAAGVGGVALAAGAAFVASRSGLSISSPAFARTAKKGAQAFEDANSPMAMAKAFGVKAEDLEKFLADAERVNREMFPEDFK